MPVGWRVHELDVTITSKANPPIHRKTCVVRARTPHTYAFTKRPRDYEQEKVHLQSCRGEGTVTFVDVRGRAMSRTLPQLGSKQVSTTL